VLVTEHREACQKEESNGVEKIGASLRQDTRMWNVVIVLGTSK